MTPGGVALLWSMTTLFTVMDAVFFQTADTPAVSSTLFISGTAILCGLVVAWIYRLGESSLKPVGAFILLAFTTSVLDFLTGFGASDVAHRWIEFVLGCLYLLAVMTLASIPFGRGQRPLRRVFAAVTVFAIYLGAAIFAGADDGFMRLSADVRPLIGRQALPVPPADPDAEVDDDVLWAAQDGLVSAETSALKARIAGRTNVYVMAVAASGLQGLFSREGHQALLAARTHFGDAVRGSALLSNGGADLMHSALATRANIARVSKAIGERTAGQDILFAYLVSHGGRTAELSSSLPGFRLVQPISAASTAKALREAGVPRRIIVISACYSGTWIPALADANTIIVTAAAKDRTSFGCDDSRRLTVFGDAFLGSLAAPGVSLSEAFDDAKRKITAEETEEKDIPSLPQVFVGANMRALWTARSGLTRTASGHNPSPFQSNASDRGG